MLKKQVQKYIDDKALFNKKDKVLIALSGGADSVALFRILHSLGYSIECMHCNFHLRGEESDRDEQFVNQLCEKYQVKLHVNHFQTEEYARMNHISIEMAARELRYQWFEEVRNERNASVIAVAHHCDDNVETFLLNLLRGTGIDGLKGIQAKNGYLVRPLLQETRNSIEAYLKALSQDYVIDCTNLQDEFIRNKIRLNILPIMKEINPSVVESISQTCSRLSEVATIYHNDRQEFIRKNLEQTSDESYRISIKCIKQDIAPLSCIHEILYPLGFNSTQEKNIWKCLHEQQPGKTFYSKDWEIIRDRDYLIIQKTTGLDELPQLVVEERDITPDFLIKRDKELAYLDADKITFPLTIRRWKLGDKFIPLGMIGKKNVSDYLTDKKMNVSQKKKQCVVCSGVDIVWLVNERIDNRYRITEKTKRVLIIQIR